MRAIPILAAITLIACSPATDNTVTRIELTPIPITHVDSEAIEILASLTDPTKLDSLTGKRAVTPRLRKACYWLHTATDPAEAIEQAQKQNGSHGTLRAQETASALLRSINHIRKKAVHQCSANAPGDPLQSPKSTRDASRHVNGYKNLPSC